MMHSLTMKSDSGAFCLITLAAIPALAAAGEVRFEFPTYAQDLEVTFNSEAAAAKAAIVMTPLFNGYEWAISGRRDDNNPKHLETRAVLTKHGHKTTWYLNGVHFWAGQALIAQLPQLLKGGALYRLPQSQPSLSAIRQPQSHL